MVYSEAAPEQLNFLWYYQKLFHSFRYISAKDGKWEEFKCPIFLGCSVSVTGFGTSERNSIQKLITKFGGQYSGAMQQDVTTHLIVHKPEGKKIWVLLSYKLLFKINTFAQMMLLSSVS